MEFLDGGKWKKHFPVLFPGNMAQLMDFVGLFILPIKLGGQSFPVIHGLEKPKLLHTGTSTRHATSKSTLLSQFPYCELCDNDKQSNYSLTNVMFCSVQEPYFLIFACLQVLNDRREKRYDFPIDLSPTCTSLNVKFSIPTKNLESFSHFLPFLINPPV